MRKLVVHIGYPKCASTYIQKEIFSNLDCNYISGPFNVSPLSDEFNQAYLIRRLREQAGSKLKDVTILSRPGLSSFDHSPHYYHQLFSKLKTFGNNIKIILIIRNQLDTIKSWFTYATTTGRKTLNFRSFKSFSDDFAPKLNYQGLIEECFSFFDSRSVLILPMELLAHNYLLFTKEMEKFCETKLVHPPREQFLNRSNKSEAANYLWRAPNLFILSVEWFLRKSGVNTSNDSIWNQDIKRGYHQFKIFLNSVLFQNQYVKSNIKLKYNSEFVQTHLQYFIQTNNNIQQYIDHSLRELGYPIY